MSTDRYAAIAALVRAAAARTAPDARDVRERQPGRQPVTSAPDRTDRTTPPRRESTPREQRNAAICPQCRGSLR
ncbi:hypothetical protein [Streptomyces sp. CdTB01]|uniref:hypothetical protein n=1 Tax=Streptomyces sp. CdTB01 TaxID=1725411 RepID=UPI00073A53E1|nr:hypothetical protein [Streptomyces sp. CdTB01]ALV39218.1 hypothetical protein AS200_44790 [Streptomyces sp. CdTB01]